MCICVLCLCHVLRCQGGSTPTATRHINVAVFDAATGAAHGDSDPVYVVCIMLVSYMLKMDANAVTLKTSVILEFCIDMWYTQHVCMRVLRNST